MSYSLEVEARALKAVAALPPDLRDRVRDRVAALADDPRPPGAKALRGALKGMMRVRVGDHRIVYQVDDVAQSIRVAAIAHRSKVYD